MRKILALLLCASVLLGSASMAAAESIDLESMSSAALASLIAKASAILENRLASSSPEVGSETIPDPTEKPKSTSKVVPQGNYVVGDYLPAGIYSLASKTPSNLALIFIYSSEAGKADASGLLNAYSLHESAETRVGRVRLEKGNYIEITGGSIIFRNQQ